MLIGQRIFRHQGTRGYRLKITKMPHVPFTVWSGIDDERKVRLDCAAFTVNAMTTDTSQLGKECTPPRDSGIDTGHGVEVFHGRVPTMLRLTCVAQ